MQYANDGYIIFTVIIPINCDKILRWQQSLMIPVLWKYVDLYFMSFPCNMVNKKIDTFLAALLLSSRCSGLMADSTENRIGEQNSTSIQDS